MAKSLNPAICDCPKRGTCSCTHAKHENCLGMFHRYSIIKASAGTGKTYQLAMRFIQLLALGAYAENILALTFTRKAAGEIYNRVITRLIDMIEKKTICYSLDQSKLTDILRGLLNCPKSIQISTIDSFFAKLLNSFAPELGIWGQSSLVDYDDNRYRREVVQRWIPEISKNREEIDELRELLKTMNNNQESVMLESNLLALMDRMYETYLRYENADGNAISWGCTIPVPADPYHNAILSYLDDLKFLAEKAEIGILISDKGNEKENTTYRKRLSAFVDFASNIKTEYVGVIPDEAKQLFKNLTNYNEADWCLQDGRLAYTKKESIPADVTACIQKVFLHVAHLAFLQAGKRTDAIHRLLQKFNEIYSSQVRNYGKLTFTDLPYLLARAYQDSSSVVAGSSMEALEYRLDSKILHYLFDEFQDTSDTQWRIFDRMTSNQLLSCIPDDFRSFFCVGDIKQSIYGWRGGDPKLFGYLEHKTDAFTDELGYRPTSSLTKSYRSSQSVLDLVNHVFADNGNGEPKCLKRLEFEPHTTALQKPGFSALLVMTKPAKDSDDDLIHINATVIFRTLKKIQPAKRGLSVGILVQSNKNANAYFDELNFMAHASHSDMVFSAEGRAPLTDISAFYVLKQLLILAEHPGDKNAIEYLRMLVWSEESKKEDAELMQEEALQERLGFADEYGDLSANVRHAIAKDGLATFIARFIDVFGNELSTGDYKKLESIQKLAEDFVGTTDEFLKSFENSTCDEKSLENTIQIMTIHKSKGLEFDVLFTPDLGNPKGNPGASHELMVDIPDPIVQYNSEFPQPQWISYFPDDVFIGHIPAYTAYKEKKSAEDDFAKLCKTYVALTRAKYALFVMVQPPDKTSQFAPDKWILERLYSVENAVANNVFFEDIADEKLIAEIPYMCGDSEWYQNVAIKDTEHLSNQLEEDTCKMIKMIPSTHHTRLASKEHQLQISVPAEKRFSIKSMTETGTLVHSLFEKIEFLSDDWDAELFFSEHIVEKQNLFAIQTMDIVRKATEHTSPIYHALLCPDGNPQLWRERRFLLMNEAKELVPGAFDRVLIWRNSSGMPQRAEIYDYKSDALTTPDEFLERHQGQLNLYRTSLSKMLGLDEARISCKILALRPCLVIDVPT